MPSNHLILCCPLLLLPSLFPSIRVFSTESAYIRWPKYWNFSIGTLQWIFRVDFLWDWLIWSPGHPRDSQESYPAPQFKNINSSVLNLLYGPILTSVPNYWKNHNSTSNIYSESNSFLLLAARPSSSKPLSFWSWLLYPAPLLPSSNAAVRMSLLKHTSYHVIPLLKPSPPHPLGAPSLLTATWGHRLNGFLPSLINYAPYYMTATEMSLVQGSLNRCHWYRQPYY